MLLSFAGPPALSDFRRLPLLERCRQALPDLDDLQSPYFYVVQLERPINTEDQARLTRILKLAIPFHRERQTK